MKKTSSYIVSVLLLTVFFCMFSLPISAKEDCVWSEWLVDQEPTCTSVGHCHRICLFDPNAPHSETKVLPMLAHDYIVTETFPTCTQRGIRTYVCTVCGDTYTEEFGTYAEHQYQQTLTQEATCTSEGEYTYTCTVCEDTYKVSIDKTEHHYDVTIIKEPDCQSLGIKQHICIRCGDTFTEECGTLQPHFFEEFIKEENEYEITFLRCKNCGYESEISRTELSLPETFVPSEESDTTVKNIVMITIDTIALGVFSVWIFPDFKILRWYNRKKKMFLINKLKK